VPGTALHLGDVDAGKASQSGQMATLNGTVVLFGGFDGKTALDETWTWNGTSWMQQSVTGPSARYNASMATVGGP
jgi:hypothetical protein